MPYQSSFVFSHGYFLHILKDFFVEFLKPQPLHKGRQTQHGGKVNGHQRWANIHHHALWLLQFKLPKTI